jgi:DNA mismatch repair protein MutL
MNSIELLPDDVINQIAAGEVVERPSHLVKELCENALDAGATEIDIEVGSGGCDILVRDNGFGIESSELQQALLRHRTSKLRASEDLWRLNSYGFRGEALASIASVSDLSLSSRVKGEEQGSRIRCRFGCLEPLVILGHREGTEVRVENLFENLPVRLKFLKSAATEIAQVRQVVKALALVHPQVQWRFLIDKRLDLFLPRVDLSSRIAVILDQGPVFPGKGEIAGYQTQVWFSDPHKTLKTNKGIWIFVQGRWVQDRALVAAVMEGYRNVLMTQQYPHIVVQIYAPLSSVDINVHPTKSQVKFENPSEVFRSVVQAIRSGLESQSWMKTPSHFYGNGYQNHNENHNESQRQNEKQNHNESQRQNEKQNQSESQRQNESQIHNKNYHNENHQNQNWNGAQAHNQGISRKQKPQPMQLQVSSPELEYVSFPNKFDQEDSVQSVEQVSHCNFDQSWKENSSLSRSSEDSNSNLSSNSNPSSGSILVRDNSSASSSISSSRSSSDGSLWRWSSLQILGQVGLTYIVCQNRDGIVFIDQHAADERVRFERWKKKLEKQEFAWQDLLWPMVFDVSLEKKEILLGLFSRFQEFGLKLEDLGPTTVGIVSHADWISEKSLPDLFASVLDEVMEWGETVSLEKFRSEWMATQACHQALRAGKPLSRLEIEKLLKDMDEFPLSSFCPHGRPVSVKKSFIDLDKEFGRIVT